MRIFISTGEVSGDLQGAMLVEALYRQAQRQGKSIDIVALGGDRMAEAGAKIIAKTTEIGSIGLLESLPFILPTNQAQKQAKAYLRDNPPDLVILIDYHDPNIIIGNYIRQHYSHVPIVYYIAPQAWVWTPFPANSQQIIDVCDHLLAIFPQEAKYFQQRGASVQWVGHPIIDRVQTAPTRDAARTQLQIAPDCPVMALIPASRRQEMKYLLPSIFAAAQRVQAQVPEIEFLIPLSLPNYRAEIEAAIAQYQLNARLIENQTLPLIAAADCAIAKSGTVNLEIALLNVPQVVIYRLHPVTMWIARHILGAKIPFISPVNLTLMESIVPELLQEEATSDRIAQESLDLLLNPRRRQKTFHDYQRMRAALGEPGVCDRATAEIFALTENN
ncbi:MAG: lipid-A-disaccharide synthase [Kamptonema sp. SIO4C4]|nr:lipid-A-disaccharide synthase [Kamptonema sp. SIO4C4]